MGQHSIRGAPAHKQRQREKAELRERLEITAERLRRSVELPAPHHGMLGSADLLAGVKLGAGRPVCAGSALKEPGPLATGGGGEGGVARANEELSDIVTIDTLPDITPWGGRPYDIQLSVVRAACRSRSQ